MPAVHNPSPTRWWTLAVVALGTFMLMLDLSVVAIALPQIHQSLHSSFADLQWVFDAYALTLAIFLVAAGSFADRVGRKKVFQIGFGLFTLASLACGLADSATALSLFRAVQGVGAAIMFAVGPAMLSHEFHGRERATAFTVFGAAVGLAVATGPLIGGSLTHAFSWRWIFHLNVPVGAIALLIGLLRVRESYNRSAAPTDWLGMITFSIALGAVVLAIIRAPEVGWTSTITLTLFLISGVALLLFVGVERHRGQRAMIDFNNFGNPTFVGVSLVAMIGNAGALPSIFFETSYLENMLRTDAWGAGLRFLPLTVAMFIAGAIGGSLIGKLPFRVLLGGSTMLMGVGLLLLNLTGTDSSWAVLIPSMVISGFGMGAFNPARAAVAVGVVEPARSGVASGINETFQQVGIAVGIAAVGAYFEHRVAGEFTASTVGKTLDPGVASQAAQAISAGGIDAVANGAGALRAEILTAAQNAYLAAFHDAMTLCAVLGLLAGALGFILIRARDLHPSALSTVPPDTSGAGLDTADSDDVEPQDDDSAEPQRPDVSVGRDQQLVINTMIRKGSR